MRKSFGLLRFKPIWSTMVLLSFLLVSCLSAESQSESRNTIPINASNNKNNPTEAKSAEEQRRLFVIALVNSLANEARSYSDLADRARVLARAADVLWDADNAAARALFVRAWDSAERGDADEVTVKTKDKAPDMVIALRRMSGQDLRFDVLSLASRRDRALGELFLAKLKSDTERDSNNSKNTRASRDVYSGSAGASRRLQVAGKLLNEGQVDQAREFALPALNDVNSNSINFLSELRAKSPAAADQIFATLLARTELDSSSDANTVSGLSSYAFSPGFYVVFWADGHTNWTQPDGPTTPPNLPAPLRDRFLQVAAGVLLRPLPPPDQDFSSCGPNGRLRVISRLLPLFDQYAPDSATALRGQLQSKAGQQIARSDNQSQNEGIKPQTGSGNMLETMQDELDHAKSSSDRDVIYATASVSLAPKGDKRARDLADSIDDANLRQEVQHYVSFEFVKFAIQKKDAAEVARFAKAEQLTHVERAWAYVRTARLLNDSDHERALYFLQQATDEARRIEMSDPDRAFALTAIADELVTADRARAWEMLSEAVKAANSAEDFVGDDVKTPKPSMVATRRFTKFIRLPGEDFRLSRALRPLAEDELERTVELAKTFKYDAPRANATLAIARAILEPAANKSKDSAH